MGHLQSISQRDGSRTVTVKAYEQPARIEEEFVPESGFTAADSARVFDSPAVKDGRKMTDEEKRRKLLNERFCTEGIDYMREVFGLDLWSPSVPVEVVQCIADGRLTPPLEVVVRPVVWDRDSHVRRKVQPLKAACSLVVRLPFDPETRKPVPPSKSRHVYVASYPCRRYLQRAVPDADMRVPACPPGGLQNIVFTAAQRMALEGIGLRGDRLYPGSFNTLPYEDRLALVQGRPVGFTGEVRIEDGFGSTHQVCIAGEGRMRTGADGLPAVSFRTNYPSEPGEDDVLDVVGAAVLGKLQLDVFEHDDKFVPRTDAYGNPVLNKAGENLVDFGVSLGPVGGWLHSEKWDESRHRYVKSSEYSMYSVAVVNGGFCVQRMKRVKDLDVSGNPVEAESAHWEIPEIRLTDDGKVRVRGQKVTPVSDEELEAYKRGVGGVFKGYTEYRDGHKPVTRNVFLVPDVTNNDYPRPFDKETGENIKKRLEEMQVRRRKQDYSRQSYRHF